MDRSTEFEDLASIPQEAINERFDSLNNPYLPPQLPPPSTPSPQSTPSPSSQSTPPTTSPLSPSPPPLTLALYNGPCLSSLGCSGYLYIQTGAYSQGQYHPYPEYGFPAAAAAGGNPAVSPLQNGNPPMLRLDYGFIQPLHPIGTLNGKIVHAISGGNYHPCVPAAPPWPKTFKTRQHSTHQEGSVPYVKKPSNAFMLFVKEHRPNVDAEIKSRGSAAVNMFLGQIWRSLTKEEQAKYYHQADQERRLHEHEHPDWSCKENYGKKRKRVKCRAPTDTEASAPTPEKKASTGQ